MGSVGSFLRGCGEVKRKAKTDSTPSNIEMAVPNAEKYSRPNKRGSRDATHAATDTIFNGVAALGIKK
mgnify:CR=1 FL=1